MSTETTLAQAVELHRLHRLGCISLQEAKVQFQRLYLAEQCHADWLKALELIQSGDYDMDLYLFFAYAQRPINQPQE